MSEKKTPEQWEAEYGLEVRDPDGWRHDNTPFNQPITLPDFWRRYTASTARMITEAQRDRITADVKAAKHEDAPAHGAAAARRIRIETGDNPDGKKRVGLNPAHGGRVLVDDQDISAHVMAVDIHIDGKSIPTARLETVGLELAIDAIEAAPETRGPEPFPPILCIQCLIDRHNHVRTDDPNPAQVMINGNSSCLEHFQIIDGPIMPDRSPNGIIIPGANGSGH